MSEKAKWREALEVIGTILLILSILWGFYKDFMLKKVKYEVSQIVNDKSYSSLSSDIKTRINSIESATGSVLRIGK